MDKFYNYVECFHCASRETNHKNCFKLHKIKMFFVMRPTYVIRNHSNYFFRKIRKFLYLYILIYMKN